MINVISIVNHNIDKPLNEVVKSNFPKFLRYAKEKADRNHIIFVSSAKGIELMFWINKQFVHQIITE
jgi:hypothetical protein